jgi:putative acetyltransferase
MTNNNEIRIQYYENKFAREFAEINYGWLENYQLIEEGDRKYLDNPREHIIDKGGQIILLLNNENVIGTCAMIHHNNDVVELAKFAIVNKEQGKGFSKLLVKEAITYSINHNYKRIILVSSTKLGKALKLYESTGFKYKELPGNLEYETADIYMELELSDLTMD